MAIEIAQEPTFLTGQQHVDELNNAALSKSFGGSSAPAQVATSPQGGANPIQGSVVDSQAQAATNTSVSERSAPQQGLSFGTYNPDVGSFGKLFEPLTKGVQEGRQELGKTGAAFNQAVGARESYGPQTEQSLDKILAGLGGDNPTRAASVTAGKGLVNSSYGGPMDLESAIAGQDDVAKAQARAQELQTRSQALSGTAGVEDLIKGANPGLTAGQLAYEAKGLGANPKFNQARQSVQGSVGQLLADILRGKSEASALGQARTAEEQGIATGSRNYLQGKQQGVLGDIDTQVGKEQGSQDAALAAFQKLMQTGDLNDLNAVPQDVRGNLSSEDFQSEARKTAEEIPAVLQGINAKYPDLQGVPPLELRINAHGREVLGFSPDWWKQHQGEHTTQEWNVLRNKAVERQREYVQAGFDPRKNENLTGSQWATPYAQPGEPKTVKGAGMRSTIAPMFSGGDMGIWQPEDIRGYFKFDPGVSPARENIATDGQRKIISGINEILDMQNADLANPTEVFRKASLLADVKTYLERETQALADRKGQIDANTRQWIQEVKTARHEYVKAVSSKAWGQALGGVGAAIGGMSGYAIGAVPGYYVGNQVGQYVGTELA